MELTGLYPIIKRWFAVILVATAMSGVVGLLLGSTASKTYEARAEMLVGPLSTDSDTMRASGDLAQTYAQLATSDQVLNRVGADLDLRESQLKTGVRATANSTTRFLVVKARSHNSADAAKIANGVSEQLLALSNESPTRPEGQLRVIDPAHAAKFPVSPKLDLIVPLAAVAGLLGSVTLVLLLEFIGDTAESVEKVDALTSVPTLTLKGRRSLPGGRFGTRDPDPLRIIATQAELAAPKVHCVLITGVANHDGTAELAAQMAQLWSDRRGRVTTIDATTGATQTLLHGGVAVPLKLTSGPPASVEAIDEVCVRGILNELHDGRLVVVYAEPATVSAATLVWARVADVTILSVRRFQARRSTIEEVVTNLRAVDANLAFSVLHDRSRAKGGPKSFGGSVDPDTTAVGSEHVDPDVTDGISGGEAATSASPRRPERLAPSGRP